MSKHGLDTFKVRLEMSQMETLRRNHGASMENRTVGNDMNRFDFEANRVTRRIVFTKTVNPEDGDA